MNELALFAGAGGGILGGKLLGWRTVCAVEIEPYARRVLLARQDDKCLDPFPIWDDVRTFDGKPWRGLVDVISGGFPCQDISAAGKGAGIDGKRSGLWREFARIIDEVRPSEVLVENSPLLVGRGLAVVLGDLAQMGYDARWGVLGADQAGLFHKRERFWLHANDPKNPNTRKREPDGCGSNLGLTRRPRPKDSEDWKKWLRELVALDVVSRVSSYSEGRRAFYGLADGVDRLKCIGNGQVPTVVRLAWKTLSPVKRLLSQEQ